jgi:hypothetical protein
MARKKSEGSTKKRTVVKEFIKLEDLPEVLKSKFNCYRLSPHSVDWAMRVAGGENPMTVTSEIYSENMDKAEIKRQTNKLLSNPKIQQMVKTLRDNLKHETYIDANMIMRRFDMLYSEALYDNDRFSAINILKEMAKIIKDNSGNITVTDMTIKFELNNGLNVKQREIEAADDAEVVE